MGMFLCFASETKCDFLLYRLFLYNIVGSNLKVLSSFINLNSTKGFIILTMFEILYLSVLAICASYCYDINSHF